MRINLLPWREKARAQRQRRFIATLLVCSTIFVLLPGYWYWYNLGLISHQKQRNHYLRTEIKQASKALQEIHRLEGLQQDLLARMQVVNQLQSSRPLGVHLFDELVNVLPEGVQLTELAQSGNIIRLLGRAGSNARVSTLMRNIGNSVWLSQPELLTVAQTSHPTGRFAPGVHDFSLNMQLILPVLGGDTP